MTDQSPIRFAPLPPADVCIIVEGCYPYVPGGVSGWIDWLIKSQPETTFSIVALWPRPTALKPRYTLPPNVTGLGHLYLQDFGGRPRTRLRVPPGLDGVADALSKLSTTGGRQELAAVIGQFGSLRKRIGIADLFNSPLAWRLVEHMYRRDMPYGSFLHYFWAWRALLGGLFATLEFELPQARIYHTISTGYAGVLAARAALETGRPALLTEHGIYTNERRIELLMADWVADTIDKGHALEDTRFDLRDMWVRGFEAYARTCYESMTRVVTLYEDNQQIQKALGAGNASLQVIANGIELDRFEKIAAAAPNARPTMALIGRVVPIKDVKSFIQAAALLKPRIPQLRAWVIGPTDEDKEYYEECRALVEALDMRATVEFTGAVNILDYLSQIHVMVLTSLSESQPLVVLEAGAAGIPFVATNVGSCREIIEGRPDEVPPLGHGGVVTDLVAPDQIADAVAGILGDEQRRRELGDTLRRRVTARYTSLQATRAYTELYAELLAAPSNEPLPATQPLKERV